MPTLQDFWALVFAAPKLFFRVSSGGRCPVATLDIELTQTTMATDPYGLATGLTGTRVAGTRTGVSTPIWPERNLESPLESLMMIFIKHIRKANQR